MKTVLNRLSIRAKLAVLAAVGLLGLLLMGLYMSLNVYHQSHEARRATVRHAVESAYGVLEWAHQQETSGQLSRDQAQKLARQAIAKMRPGGNEYFWLTTCRPRW